MALHLYSLGYSNDELYHSRAAETQSREMDNRGSKSNKSNALFVQEQRVDGSLLLNTQRFNNLRCTLRGFERITLYGIPSNKILNKKLYSTINALRTKNLRFAQKLPKDLNIFNLNP